MNNFTQQPQAQVVSPNGYVPIKVLNSTGIQVAVTELMANSRNSMTSRSGGGGGYSGMRSNNRQQRGMYAAMNMPVSDNGYSAGGNPGAAQQEMDYY